MTRKVIFAIALPMLFGLTIVQSLRPVGFKTSTAQAQSSTDAIPAPTQWVAFDARHRRIGSRNEMSAGRYYRRSDGSTRQESGPEDNPAKVISIRNISAVRSFTYNGEKWWSNPMRLPREGYRPALRSLTRTNGLTAWPEKIQGFEVYRMTQPSGLVRFQAPALNFFSLSTSFNGAYDEFYDINIREQPEELFFPPAGVPVEERQELAGIIANVTEDEEKALRERLPQAQPR